MAGVLASIVTGCRTGGRTADAAPGRCSIAERPADEQRPLCWTCAARHCDIIRKRIDIIRPLTTAVRWPQLLCRALARRVLCAAVSPFPARRLRQHRQSARPARTAQSRRSTNSTTRVDNLLDQAGRRDLPRTWCRSSCAPASATSSRTSTTSSSRSTTCCRASFLQAVSDVGRIAVNTTARRARRDRRRDGNRAGKAQRGFRPDARLLGPGRRALPRAAVPRPEQRSATASAGWATSRPTRSPTSTRRATATVLRGCAS